MEIIVEQGPPYMQPYLLSLSLKVAILDFHFKFSPHMLNIHPGRLETRNNPGLLR